jgi:hypothetical protein
MTLYQANWMDLGPIGGLQASGTSLTIKLANADITTDSTGTHLSSTLAQQYTFTNAPYLGTAAPGNVATTKTYVDNLAITGGKVKECLLASQQLSDSQGILAATALFIATLPTADDSIVITDGTTTETFVFKAASGGAFEVTIGADVNAAMTNLVAKINTDSVAWKGVLDTALNKINAVDGRVIVLYEQASAVGASVSKVYYGTHATLVANIVDFHAEMDYVLSTSAALPTSLPADSQFGIRRQVATIIINEIHTERALDGTYIWDDDASHWQLLNQSNFSDATKLVKGVASIGNGLEIQTGLMQVGGGDGIVIGTNGISVGIDTTRALAFDSGTPKTIGVVVNALGGLEISTGLQINLEATAPTLYINASNELALKMKSGGGLNVDSSGTYVDSTSIIPLTTHTIDSTDAANHYFTLAAPIALANIAYVRVIPLGGPEQINHELIASSTDFGVGTDANANLDRVYFANTTGVARLSATDTFTSGNILTIEYRN